MSFYLKLTLAINPTLIVTLTRYVLLFFWVNIFEHTFSSTSTGQKNWWGWSSAYYRWAWSNAYYRLRRVLGTLIAVVRYLELILSSENNLRCHYQVCGAIPIPTMTPDAWCHPWCAPRLSDALICSLILISISDIWPTTAFRYPNTFLNSYPNKRHLTHRGLQMPWYVTEFLS